MFHPRPILECEVGRYRKKETDGCLHPPPQVAAGGAISFG